MADPDFAASFGRVIVEHARMLRQERQVIFTLRSGAPLDKNLCARLLASLQPDYEGFELRIQNLFGYAMLDEAALRDLMEEMKRDGVPINGFLDRCRITITGQNITVGVCHGTKFLQEMEFERLLADRVAAHTGVRPKVTLTSAVGEAEQRQMEEKLERKIAPPVVKFEKKNTAPSIKVVQEGATDFSGDAARESHRTNEPQRQRFERQNRRNNNDRFNKNRNNRQDGRNGRNGNDRVKNRWNNNHQEGNAPQNNAPRELAPPEPVDGLLEITNKGFGFLRKPDNDFDAFAEAVYVPQDMIRKFGLRPAVWVHGQACRHDRGILLTEISAVNGDAPEKARKSPHFEELKAVNPNKRISFETRPERYTTRTLDLIAPIGRGQRGLIVSPPRAGKTTLLQHMAEAILENYKDSIHLMVLLVDERPEEVTEFKRSLPGAEVYASSNDGRVRDHCRMAELCIERAKRLVEAGQHVFLLMDSITRLARAYNNADKGSGRTMSGGIDARALEMPRRLFAAARNTRQAGSLTIIATALVETNSRMDDLIFQEFKGTGNMELVLNRRIAEQYIFPAVDILKSGTRREELIMPEAWLYKMNLIRRALAGHKPVEAMERFLFFLNKYPSNAQMLLDLKQKA